MSAIRTSRATSTRGAPDHPLTVAQLARAIRRGPFSFMDPEFLLRALKAVVEVAGLAYLGQALVGAFSGANREQNVIYQVFRIVTGPVTRFTRILMPKFIPDRHIPFVAFGLLVWVWIFLIFGLASLKRGG
jgi:hypothetical protein